MIKLGLKMQEAFYKDLWSIKVILPCAWHRGALLGTQADTDRHGLPDEGTD